MAKKSAQAPVDDEPVADPVADDGGISDDQIASTAADDAADGGGEGDAGEVTPPPSWRDQAKEHGIDLSGFDDDAAAFKHLGEQFKSTEQLRQEAAQAKQLAQYGEQFLPYASEFQQFLASRQQQAPQADPLARPEYDPAWLNQVTTNEAGEYVPIPGKGGTVETVRKLQNVVDWQRRFLAEPDKYMQGFVDNRAAQIARQMVDEQIQSMRSEFSAQHFVTNNRDWLYARDDDGRPVMTNGQPTLSEEGSFFASKLNEAKDIGLNNQGQEAYAMNMLRMRREFSGAGAGGGAAPKSAADKKQDFLKKAAGHGASPSKATQREVTKTDPPGNTNSSLAEMLRTAFAEAGVDDKTFAGV